MKLLLFIVGYVAVAATKGWNRDEISEAARPFADYVASVISSRDSSHGMAHMMRVRKTALALADVVVPRPGSNAVASALHIELTALAHDVRDHKYVTNQRSSNEALRRMRRALFLCGLSDADVYAVILAAENVSLSKQLSGEMQSDELERLGARWLRDVVSDADKLDALGVQGLERVAAFHRDELEQLRDVTTLALSSRLRELSANVAEYRASYLVFEESKTRAEVLLRQMRELLSNPRSMALFWASWRSAEGVSKEVT